MNAPMTTSETITLTTAAVLQIVMGLRLIIDAYQDRNAARAYPAPWYGFVFLFVGFYVLSKVYLD